jgi:hypothetical protein
MLLMVGCTSDDQKIVEELEGTWQVTQVTVNGIPADESTYENDSYTFESCKVAQGDCDGTYSTEDPTKGTTSYSFTYSIHDEGTKITINMSILGIPSTSTGTIEEHSDSRFVWTVVDDFGDETTTTIEK